MLAVPSGRRGEGSLLPVVAQGWLVVSPQGGLRCDQSDQVCCGGTRPVGVRRDAFFSHQSQGFSGRAWRGSPGPGARHHATGADPPAGVVPVGRQAGGGALVRYGN